MWDKLKKILQYSNGRGVIVEDGEPKYVILPIDEYISLKEGATPAEEFGTPEQQQAQESPQYRQEQAPSEYSANNDQDAMPIDLSGIDVTDVEAETAPSYGDIEEAYADNVSLDDLPIA